MSTRMIQYIGNKPSKRDTVLRTSRQWERGACIPVPEPEAGKYLQHPDVFRDVTDNLDKEGNPPALAPLRTSRPVSPATSQEAATSQQLRTELNALQEENEALRVENETLKAKLQGGGAGEPPPPEPPEDPTERQQAVIKAIGQLDPDKDFTAAGKPKTDALSAALGWTVSGEERDAVWQVIVDAANE